MTDEEKPRVVLPMEEGSLSQVELPTPVRFVLGKSRQYIDVRFSERDGKTVLEIRGGDALLIHPMSSNLFELTIHDPFEESR